MCTCAHTYKTCPKVDILPFISSLPLNGASEIINSNPCLYKWENVIPNYKKVASLVMNNMFLDFQNNVLSIPHYYFVYFYTNCIQLEFVYCLYNPGYCSVNFISSFASTFNPLTIS